MFAMMWITNWTWGGNKIWQKRESATVDSIPPVRIPNLFFQHAISTRNSMRSISEKWNLHFTKSTLLTWYVSPWHNTTVWINCTVGLTYFCTNIINHINELKCQLSHFHTINLQRCQDKDKLETSLYSLEIYTIRNSACF